jgi:hypothetical protein
LEAGRTVKASAGMSGVLLVEEDFVCKSWCLLPAAAKTLATMSSCAAGMHAQTRR